MSTLPFDDLLSENPSFTDVQAGSSTLEEGRPKGENVLSPFDDLMVGEVASPPQPDLDTTKVHPVPQPFQILRGAKHRPEIRGILNLFENGRWAVGLAGQALGVGADVLRAWTAGEHESNPEQFAQRAKRGKTIFDEMNVHSAIQALENTSDLEDPVQRAQGIEDLKTKYAFLNDSTDLMLEPKLREKLAEIQYGLAEGPQFMSIAEMIYENSRPALGNPILDPLMQESVFSIAKDLRKDPTEVTLGEVAVTMLDAGQRGWVRATEPIASQLPEKSEPHLVKVPLISKTMLLPGGPTRGFIQEDLPALMHTVLMQPGELFYDPLFVAGESGVAAKLVNVGTKGAVRGVETLGRGASRAYEVMRTPRIKVKVATDVGEKIVESFTPHIAESQAAERALRGAPPTGNISSHLTSVSGIASDGVETSAQRALPTIREALMDVDNRVGGVVDDMQLKGSPEEMGRELKSLGRPKGASEKLDAFHPEGPVIRTAEPPLTVGPTPIASGFKQSKDINFFERFLSPRYVLYDDPADTISRGIYTAQRRSFFDSMHKANDHAKAFSGLNELLGKAGPRGQGGLSKRLMAALDASDKTEAQALAKLSGKEQLVATELRENFKTWLTDRQVVRGADEGLLSSMGKKLWPEEEFLIAERDGVLRRGAFPPELTDVPVMDNPVMRHLYPGMTPSDDIANSMRAISAGMIRQDVLKPAWREMAEAAKNLPPRKRQFTELWLKNLQGVPSKFSEVFDEMVHAVKADTKTPLYVSATTELSSAVLSGYYRGLLFGNMSTFFSNFFGQGFANQAATSGAFRTMGGLARHWKHAFDGTPKEVFSGGFEALFGKEVPKSNFGLKLRSQPGIKQFRDFWNDVMEPQLGMQGSEAINRSWSMHVGLAEALDQHNIRNGTKIMWKQALKGEGIDPKVRSDLMFEAMMHSDQVNHVWGVAGANPLVRHYFGQGALAHATQLLNWFPKQSEFLFGPAFRRGDMGILTNYILFTGWLSGLATKSWGINFESSAYFGSIPSAQGSGAPFPAGPSVDALWSLMSAVNEEVDGDPNQAKRHWEEVARHLETLAIPAVGAREKAEIFWRSLEHGGLYTPTHPFSQLFGIQNDRELMGFTGLTAAEQQGPVFGQAGGFDPNPENLDRNIINILRSETPARALGYPTVSDRQRRRIDTETRRLNRVWQSLMSDLVDEMLVEVQRHEGQPLDVAMKSPRMKELMEAAESQGLPIKAMFEDRILDQALPRLLRVFQDSKKLTKQQTYPYLYDAFPDYFDNPTMVWDKAHPKSVPQQDVFEDLMK